MYQRHSQFLKTGVAVHDTKLFELSDYNVYRALREIRQLDWGLSEEAVLCAVSAMLAYRQGTTDIWKLCQILDQRPDITMGMLALTQDGVSSFSAQCTSHYDPASEWVVDRLFVSRARCIEVWNHLTQLGCRIPESIRYYTNYELNLYGELGIWVESTVLSLDGITVRN